MRQGTERQANWREVIFEVTDVRLSNCQRTSQAANQVTAVAGHKHTEESLQLSGSIKSALGLQNQHCCLLSAVSEQTAVSCDSQSNLESAMPYGELQLAKHLVRAGKT